MRAILEALTRGKAVLERSHHFSDRMLERGYTMMDIYRIIRQGTLRGRATWNAKHANHEIQLEDNSLDGRLTRVILGLRRGGPCIGVTVIEVKDARRSK